MVRTDGADSFGIAIFLGKPLRREREVLVGRNFVRVLCADAEETISANSSWESQIWGRGEPRGRVDGGLLLLSECMHLVLSGGGHGSFLVVIPARWLRVVGSAFLQKTFFCCVGGHQSCSVVGGEETGTSIWEKLP